MNCCKCAIMVTGNKKGTVFCHYQTKTIIYGKFAVCFPYTHSQTQLYRQSVVV